jgi:hypothetical protein
MLLGFGDPLEFLKQEVDCDWWIIQAVVEVANHMYAERKRTEYEALASMIGNAVGKAMGG